MHLHAQALPKENAQHPLTYLALGDSYTIGEAVPLRENFPYLVVQLLRQKGMQVCAPEIIATTGWTTDELAAALPSHRFLAQYDWVTLLIGVNNQYRGRSVENYKMEFAALLHHALHFAGNNKNRVVCISIPDYGATPFAKDLDRIKIGREIDTFNNAAADICTENGIAFIDITEGSRAALTDLSLVASDGLHPSGREYNKWAVKLARHIWNNSMENQP
jgi:lysophospholipase L1-like esterase